MGEGQSNMYQNSSVAILRQRRDNIREWLEEEAPYTDIDQRHLDAHTPERAYWHHGYQAALNDVMAMLALEGGRNDTVDIPN
jgi:ribosome modulation factor